MNGSRRRAISVLLVSLLCLLVASPLAADQGNGSGSPQGTPAQGRKLPDIHGLRDLGVEQGARGPQFVPHQFVVRLKDGATQADVQSLGASWGKPIHYPGGLTFLSMGYPEGSNDDALFAALQNNPKVQSVSRNALLHTVGDPPKPLATLPNDPKFPDLWGLNNTGQDGGAPDADIDAPEAWATSTGGATVVVADIDTGIQMTHPDLAANLFCVPGEIPANGIDDDLNGYIDDACGWDFVNHDKTVYDGIDDHGTHTAGTIGAKGNNALGVVGVNWTVPILPMKFLQGGTGTLADALSAFAYLTDLATRHSLRIITSNSWACFGTYVDCGGDAFTAALTASHMLHVFAAGNNGGNNDLAPGLANYPASLPLPNIISVAASDHNDALAGFSAYGATSVDLAAPGVHILSTVPTDHFPDPYAFFSGTSMATPHVAGAAALLWGLYPGLASYTAGGPDARGSADPALALPPCSVPVASVKDLMMLTVDHKSAFTGKMVSGGRLNLNNAIHCTANPIVTASASPTFGPAPLLVTFTATAVDPAGAGPRTISNKNWNFGDGSLLDPNPNTAHTYVANGNYVATFTATDDQGNSTSASMNIVVVTLGPGTVLFVDGDRGDTLEHFFTDALAAASIPYVMVQSPVPLAPTLAPASHIAAVVWNVGYNYSQASMTPADKTWIAAYLNHGGRVYLSSQDYTYTEGLDALIHDYFWVDSVAEDTGTAAIAGIDGNPISCGVNTPLVYPFSDYSNTIVPRAGAAPVFLGPNALPRAVMYSGSSYKTVYTAFPFEAMPTAPADPNNAKTVIKRIVNWLLDGPTPCLAPPTPDINVSPLVIEVTLPSGGNTTVPMNISNTGTAPLTFEMHEAAGAAVEPPRGAASGAAPSRNSAGRQAAVSGSKGVTDGIRTAVDGPGLPLFSSTVLHGGYVAKGVGMRNIGFGSVGIALPPGATVAKAYLYWDYNNPDNLAAFQYAKINGNPVQGILIAQAVDPCWGMSKDWVYRADVTPLVPGNGVYNLSDFASGVTNGQDPFVAGRPAPQIQGATLVVIYQGAGFPVVMVQIYDGKLVVLGDATQITMSGFTATGPVQAQTTFVVADGQLPGNPASFNSVVIEPNAFPGNQGPAVWSQGGLYDTDTYIVNALIPPGATSATAGISGGGADCLTWFVQVLSVTVGLPFDAPWLSENPLQGTVQPGQTTQVQVNFDAAVPNPALTPGNYDAYLVIKSNDPDENPVNVHVILHVVTPCTPNLNCPKIAVDPLLFSFNLPPNTRVQATEKISNTGDPQSQLNWTIGYGSFFDVFGGPDAQLAGGPDAFGYTFRDSDSGGAPYVLDDISATGTLVPLGDDAHASIPMPIDFMYYGKLIKAGDPVYISSNGFISFAEPGTDDPNNLLIPNGANPNAMIAPLWDDLDPSAPGATVQYKFFPGVPSVSPSRLVVQWTHVPKKGSPATSFTFQVRLFGNSQIDFQYIELAGTSGSATIGIESLDGAIGLQVSNNAVYIHPSLRVNIQHWLQLIPGRGSTAAGAVVDPKAIVQSSSNVNVIVSTSGLPLGHYHADVKVNSNDPLNPVVVVPVDVIVQNMCFLTYGPNLFNVSMPTNFQNTFIEKLFNAGNLPCNWTLAENPDKPWMTIGPPAAGTLNPGQAVNVLLKADTTGLPNGTTDSENLALTWNGNPTVNIPFNLKVQPTAIVKVPAETKVAVNGDVIIPLDVLGIPNSLPAIVGAGLGAYQVKLFWSNQVLNALDVTGGAAPFDGAPTFSISNPLGTANLAAIQTATFEGPVGDINVAHIKFHAVGQPNACTFVTVQVIDLLNNQAEPIPSLGIGGNICVLPPAIVKTDLHTALDIYTPLTAVVDNAGGVYTSFDQVYDPSTLAPLPGVLLASYAADANYNGALLLVLQVRFEAPFNVGGVSAIDNPGGHTSFSAGTLPPGAAWPVSPVAFLALRLTGCVNQTVDFKVTYSQLLDGAGQLLQQESPPDVRTYRRGNAKNDGVINIGDALFIAQYIVGFRAVGDDPPAGPYTHVNAVNAASVKQDTGVDKITSADKLLLAQFLVGLRDQCLNLITAATPPDR